MCVCKRKTNDGTASIRISTEFRLYKDVGCIVFEQSFPDGASGVNETSENLVRLDSPIQAREYILIRADVDIVVQLAANANFWRQNLINSFNHQNTNFLSPRYVCQGLISLPIFRSPLSPRRG